MAIVIASGVTSTGLILGNNTVAGAMDTTASAFGTAVNTIVSNGAILQISSGGIGSGAVISGDNVAANKAQEIIRAGGISYDTVVNQGIGYQYVNGAVAYRTVISNGSQWGNNNAKMYDTVVRGGYQIVGAAVTAYNTVVSGGSQVVNNGGVVSGVTFFGGSGLVSSGATVSDVVISGGRFSVWGGATVNNVTVVVGNGRNAVLRPEADGATFTGDICMDLTTAVTVTTTANYLISSVSRIAASSGVTFSIKVKEYDQLAGEYCVGGGTTNITATVTTDTGKTLGTISRGAGNPAYTHTQYGAYRLYTNNYLYLSVVTGAAVYNSTTSVAQQAKVLEDAVVGNGQSAYVYADGSALRMTINGNGVVRVYGEITSATVNDTGAVIVSSGGVAKNTLVNANSQYVYAGGSALDTVVRGGNLTLAQAEAYARNITIYGGDGRLILSANGTMVDGNININISEIAGDNTSGNTFINSLSRVLNYTPHGVTFTLTVAEENQRSGNYFFGGNLNNFDVAVVTDNGKSLGTIRESTGSSYKGNWLHTQYGSYRFYNDTYIMLGVETGHPAELWDGDALEASGDTLAGKSITAGKKMYVYDGGAATGNTVDGGALLVSEGGAATGNTVVSGSAQAQGGGILSGTIVNGGMGFVRVSNGGITSETNLTVSGARELIYSGGTAIRTSLTAGGAYQNVGDYTAGVDNTGALALDTELTGGGAFQVVYSGAVASRTLVAGTNAAQHVSADAVARETTLNAQSALLRVSAGGRAEDAVVREGRADVYDGGVAERTELANTNGKTARLDVSAGAVANDTVITSGLIMVSNGGRTNRTIVRKGYEAVSSGAQAHDTVVSGGSQIVSSSGKAFDTVVSAGEQQIAVGGSAERTVAEGGIVRVFGSTTSTTLRGAAQELLYSNTTVANSTTISGGAQKVLVAGAVASDTVIYAGYQQVVAGASAWNTTIVAGNNGYASLADGAVTGGTWNFDLSQGTPTAAAMLNAWRITSGTDLVITIDVDNMPTGKCYLSSGAGGFGDTTFTVKGIDGTTIAEDFGNGDKFILDDVIYKLAIEGSGLYLTVITDPVEIYQGSTLVEAGAVITGAKILAGWSAYVNEDGTLEDAAVIKAGSNKVLVSAGGKITGAEVYGQGTTTDIRVYGGASASNARIGDANGMVRLYGGTAYDTTAVGGQFLMYNGAFASNTTVIDGGVQKLLVSGAAGTVTASNTTVSSGGWIQVGATLQQTQGSYLAGGDITTVNVLSGGTMYVEVGATAADVTLHAGASAYVYSGGQIAFTSVESDARINVRFSQATGNTEALITDWGTVAAGAELSVKEVGGAGTFKIADSVDAGLTVNYDEFDVYGGRDIGIGQNFSDAFRGLNFVLGTDGTLTAADLTIGTQTTAATLDGTNATMLADGTLATVWTANTDLSAIPVVADANTNADAWLTLDNTTVNGALYGADGNFANDVNLKFRDGSITNLAAGAKAGGSVANVNVMVGEITPDWTEVSHGTTFNGVAYAGGFGSVTGTAGTVLNAGVFKKDFYAGALANKLDAVTNVGEVSMRIFGGTFSGNIYGASAVKTVAGKNGLRHAVGDVTLTVAGGETTKGTQACIFAGGYATGDATGTVYTVESVTLDISGGSWGTACGGRGVFGGIMASGVTAEAGDVAITITNDNSPTMGNVYGGGWAQKGGTSIVGDVNISIEGGEIANVFGGGTHSASSGSENSMTETGDITITVKGGTITNAIYAKGQGANDSTGSAAVVFKGAGAFECGVYGYSYVGGEASDATLSFSGYTGTFAGAIGGFNSVTFDGVTNMTLTTADEDVSNSSWNFDVAERSTKFADIAMLNWTAADFTGDTITLNLATGDANEWSLVSAATDTVYNNFDVLVDGSAIAAELHLGDKISGGAYDGWGFTNDEGTLKFKQLA